MRADELGVLSARSSRQAASIEDTLRQSGATVLVVDGSDVVDKSTLMRRIANDLDLTERSTSWDGLADTLWGHLAASTEDHDHAVIVWRNADVLLRHSLGTFLQATTLFVDLARAVQTTDTGFPRALHLHVVFVGDDPAFASPD